MPSVAGNLYLTAVRVDDAVADGEAEAGTRAGGFGGEMHADCEAVLLEDGSRQEDVWGADW